MPLTLEDWKDRYYEQQAQFTEARGILAQERDLARQRLAEAVRLHIERAEYAEQLAGLLEALLASPSNDLSDAHEREGDQWHLTPRQWVEYDARAALRKHGIQDEPSHALGDRADVAPGNGTGAASAHEGPGKAGSGGRSPASLNGTTVTGMSACCIGGDVADRDDPTYYQPLIWLNEAAIHFESFPGGRDHNGMVLLYRAIEEFQRRVAAGAAEVISTVGIVGCKLCGAEEGPRGLVHAETCVLSKNPTPTGLVQACESTPRDVQSAIGSAGLGPIVTNPIKIGIETLELSQVARAIQGDAALAEAAAADAARWYFIEHHVLLLKADAGGCRVFFGADSTPHEENCSGATIREVVDAAMARWPIVYGEEDDKPTPAMQEAAKLHAQLAAAKSVHSQGAPRFVNRGPASNHYNAVLAILSRECVCEPESEPPYRCDACKASDNLWALWEIAKAAEKRGDGHQTSVERCICGDGFGMNLSCPLHGVDRRNEIGRGRSVRGDMTGIGIRYFAIVQPPGRVPHIFGLYRDTAREEFEKGLRQLPEFYPGAHVTVVGINAVEQGCVWVETVEEFLHDPDAEPAPDTRHSAGSSPKVCNDCGARVTKRPNGVTVLDYPNEEGGFGLAAGGGSRLNPRGPWRLDGPDINRHNMTVGWYISTLDGGRVAQTFVNCAYDADQAKANAERIISEVNGDGHGVGIAPEVKP